jgi:Ca2+-transporting ATPase
MRRRAGLLGPCVAAGMAYASLQSARRRCRRPRRAPADEGWRGAGAAPAHEMPRPARRRTACHWHAKTRQFASPLIYILFDAALLAVALGRHGDAGVILLAVVVNALIGTAQEGRAERSMASLRWLCALRDGHEAMVEAHELVPGDILLLAAGDAGGADARLIEHAQLQRAEAALTGESVPLAKAVAALREPTALADRHDMVCCGTFVSAGRARWSWTRVCTARSAAAPG